MNIFVLMYHDQATCWTKAYNIEAERNQRIFKKKQRVKENTLKSKEM